jgi:MFS family permease
MAGNLGRVGSISTAVLYAVFALSGLIAPLIIHLLSISRAVFAACCFYIIYVLSLLLHEQSGGGDAFIIVAAGLCGLGAGVFWSAQGTMWAYPTEDRKGFFLGLFWVLFNLGGVVGGGITLAANWSKGTGSSSVSTLTYITFMIVMGVGGLLSLFIANPDDVEKDDGSEVIVKHSKTSKEEIKRVFTALIQPAVLLMLPIIFYSNFFYGYQFAGFNAKVFDVRTQGFTLMCYWFMQMVGAPLVGKLHDAATLSLRARALISLSVQAVLFNISWLWCLLIEHHTDSNSKVIDITQPEFWSPFCLMLLWGLMDACIQNYCFWFLSQLSQEADQVTRLAGIYKTFQSIGSATSWAIGGAGVSDHTQLITNWAVFGFACIPTFIAAFVYLDSKVNSRAKKIEGLANISIDLSKAAAPVTTKSVEEVEVSV